MKFKLLILWYYLGFRWSRLRYRTPAQLQRLQQKRWRRLQKYLEKAPFYADLARQNVPPTEYPLIDKSVMMREFNQINTVGIDRDEALQLALEAEVSRDFSPMIDGITIGLSSGTSGNKGLFLASERERAQWVACVLDRVIGLQLRKRKVAFFLRANSKLYESAQSSLLQFRFFDIFEPMERLLAGLGDFQPELLVAQPSVLREIATAIEAGELSVRPSKVISVAEVLEPHDRQWFEKVFAQPIHEVYQCTEGFLAATCAHGTLHFNEDFLLIERRYVDESQTRFHPIITDLYRRSQPVVRYELNDVIVPQESCPCGSPWQAIKMIEGRADDVLQLPGKSGLVRVFPDFLRRAIIGSSDAISFYQLRQVGFAQLNCYLERFDGTDNPAAEYTKVIAGLQAMLGRMGIENVHIQLTDTCVHQQGNKLRRIINEHQASCQAPGHE